MGEENQGQQTPPPAGAQNTESAGEPRSVPYERFAEVNKAMRQYEKQLADLQKAQAERDEKERLARGEHETIIGELKPKAERAAKLEQSLTTYLEAELADIPEDARYLFEAGDVADRLQRVKEAKKRGLFNRPNAPVTDAGARGNVVSTATLTSEQKQMAAAAGMTEEQYAAALGKSNQG